MIIFWLSFSICDVNLLKKKPNCSNLSHKGTKRDTVSEATWEFHTVITVSNTLITRYHYYSKFLKATKHYPSWTSATKVIWLLLQCNIGWSPWPSSKLQLPSLTPGPSCPYSLWARSRGTFSRLASVHVACSPGAELLQGPDHKQWFFRGDRPQFKYHGQAVGKTVYSFTWDPPHVCRKITPKETPQCNGKSPSSCHPLTSPLHLVTSPLPDLKVSSLATKFSRHLLLFPLRILKTNILQHWARGRG